MICHLCKRKIIQKIKTVKGVNIFECKDCQFGFVDQRKRNTLDSQGEYNLEGYKENEKRFSMRFENLANRIQGYKKTGKVLDVGAGYGLLSSILHEKGYEIDIIEPMNILYYLKGKKIKHHKTTIEQFFSRCKTKYDIILLMDVIEHLKDPVAILAGFHSILNKKGIVVIQTPNYKSLMARICRNWSWWMVSDHKFFFSPKSIQLLFKKAGYTVSKLETYEDIQDFKKNLDGNFDSIRNPYIRKLQKALFFILFSPFYILLRRMLWIWNYGGLLVTIGV